MEVVRPIDDKSSAESLGSFGPNRLFADYIAAT